MSHTPGPWGVKREGGDINITSKDVPYVAQVFPCPAVDVEKNVALISSAPELLDNLIETVLLLENALRIGAIDKNLIIAESIRNALPIYHATIAKVAGSKRI